MICPQFVKLVLRARITHTRSELRSFRPLEVDPPTLAFLLHDVARLLKKRLEQNSRGSGLTRSQWQILAYLAGNEGINQKGLAELLEMEPTRLGRTAHTFATR